MTYNLLNLRTSGMLALTFVLRLTSLSVLQLTSLTFASPSVPDRYHDYCVIGAGPAGLQLGYFLKRAGRDYVVFERSNISGSFFLTYPRHRRLISINKRHTGITNKEFNMRHDWNSLLSHDESLLFREYSKDMFPHADRMVDYLRDFQHKLGIKVQFHTDLSNVHSVPNASAPDGVVHVMNDQHGNEYTCRVLVLATGMWKPNIPDIPGIEHAVGYETMSLNPDDYEGQSVIIVGGGNSAFETADHLYGVTNLVHIVTRSRVRLAWATHYVGDLRAVNNALLDTYQLKSLDGHLDGDLTHFGMILRSGDKFWLLPVTAEEHPEKEPNFADLFTILGDNFATRRPYDRVLRCLGFVFDTDVFRNGTTVKREHEKYPKIHPNYELKSMPGVFMAGTASHSLDYRKSAGGFIHGFRYTARALYRLLEWRYEGVPWPALTLPLPQLTTHVLKRLNEASGPYQMFQNLADVVTFSRDGGTCTYLEEFPVHLLHELSRHTGRAASRVLVVMLDYGAGFSGPDQDVFRDGRSMLNPAMAHKANFLHPVLYYYRQLPTRQQMEQGREREEVLPRPDAIHHVTEDFLTLWDRLASHVTPLRHFLEHVTSRDLRARFAQRCFVEVMTRGRPSPSCAEGYLQGQGLSASSDMLPQAVAR